MADEVIDIDVLINTSNSANSINDLKKSVKELTNAAAGLDEGSEEFRKLSEAAGNAKDRINGVKDAIKAQTGEPIEKVTGSLKNMGAQLAGLDFKGAAASLAAFSTNLKALPFKEIMGGLKAFGSQMLVLGAELLVNPIFLLTAAIAAIGFAFYKAFGEAGDAAEELNKKLDGLAKKVESFYDRKIKIAKARGQETDELEKKQLELSAQIVNQQIKNLEKAAKAFGGLNDEQTKLLDDLREKSKDISAEIEANLSAARKKRLDDTNKHIKELQDATAKLNEKTKKQVEDNEKAAQAIRDKANAESAKKKEAHEKHMLEIQETWNKSILDAQEQAMQDSIKAQEEFEKKQLEITIDGNEEQTQEEKDYQMQQSKDLDKFLVSQYSEFDLFTSALNGAAKSSNNAYLTAFAGFATGLQAAVDQYKNAAKDAVTETDKINAKVQEISSLINAAVQAVGAIATELNKAQAEKDQARYDKQLRQLTDNQTAQQVELKKQLDAKLITQEQYDQALLNLEANTNKESYNIRKKAWEAEKKAKLNQIIIDTFQGTSAAFLSAMSLPYPANLIAGGIAAGIANAFGIAQYEKLKKTKFEDSAGGAPSGGSGGGYGGSSSSGASTGGFNGKSLEQIGPNGGDTGGGSGDAKSMNAGPQEPQKVYLVTTELTGQQNKDKILEDRAVFIK